MNPYKPSSSSPLARRASGQSRSGDYVPLLPLGRRPSNTNIWNRDEDDEQELDEYELAPGPSSRLLPVRSSDSLDRLLDEEDEEDEMDEEKRFSRASKRVSAATTVDADSRTRINEAKASLEDLIDQRLVGP
jgi:hypothetical protein